MMEIMKLPGKEEYFNEVIESHMEEINEVIKNGSVDKEKEIILKKLERINFFVSSPIQISLIINKGFIFSLFHLLNLNLIEEENNLTEVLLNNEFFIIKIVVESISDISSSLINVLFKINFRILINTF